MITQFYPGPVVKKPSSVFESTHEYHPTYYEWQAKKKGCTVEVYKKREEICREQYKKAEYDKYSIVFPYNLKEYNKYGQCRVTGLYRTYADYEGDWPKSNVPFLVTAHPLSGTSSDQFFATVGFFSTTKPTE